MEELQLHHRYLIRLKSMKPNPLREVKVIDISQKAIKLLFEQPEERSWKLKEDFNKWWEIVEELAL